MHNSEPATYDVALLRQDMTAKGWLPIDLARKAEVSHMTVSRFLSGERQTARMAKKLASALGQSVRRYLRFESTATPPTATDDRRADDRRSGVRRDGDRRRSFERRAEVR